ncbi:MAG: 6-hydroxymethylpterin diphosphokinase MptE-like protein [Synergistaceae bacterium]|nr:6-hydroxymethylpterin diphosphokinase MptE-like protein [Synergistaceae bacterium]
MKEIPTLLTKNLETLARSQPKLASRLREYLEELPALPKAEFQETPAGRWVSGLTEKPFFEKRAFLEKRKKADPSAVYLVFGTGCAPWLFHVLRSLPREALSIVIFEPSLDLLLATLSETSVFAAAPAGCRISFVVEADRTLMDEAFAWNVIPIGIFPVQKATVIAHEGEGESADFSPLESTFKKEIIYRLTLLGNSPEDTLLGVRHAALNTPRILQSPRLSDLKPFYGGKPFVCVSSGPSLEKNVHLLKDIQDKCVIVACDTILFHLLEKEIVPHMVTTIERPYITYEAWLPRVLEKYPEECKKILLVSQSVSYPLIAGRWPGPSVVVGKLDVPVDNWFTGAVLGEQLMYSGLSVAHMALSLALILEAPSASLIGQDLAYSEEGLSHASNTVPDSVLAAEQKLREGGLSVPGVLDGDVRTSTIWLTFIQIFERMIAASKDTPVYDCTEGGALIEGTKILSFQDHIQTNILAPDAVVSRWNEKDKEKSVSYEDVLGRFGQASAQLDRLDARLADMRSGITRCSAPALTPSRRQALAFSVAKILDEIHALNPVLSFIGQSYTYLSGSMLAENRFLETVEQVERWKKLHEEIVESHSFNVSFLRQWVNYSKDLVDILQRDAYIDAGKLSGSGEEEYFGLFAQWQDETSNPQERPDTPLILLTDLLSCKDPLRENWSSNGLWKAARVLHTLGRAEEGRRFMAKAYGQMEGEEVAEAVLGAFYKDWGKMAAADDLCSYPLTAEALTYLANAEEYLPGDKEIPLLKKKILERQKSLFIETGKMTEGYSEKVDLLLLRNRAENALYQKDLPTALFSVEELVWGSLESYPGTAIPHLQWLMKTTANCVDAADALLVKQSEDILGRIIGRLPSLVGHPFDFPMEFLALLKRKGIKLSLQSADTHLEEE